MALTHRYGLARRTRRLASRGLVWTLLFALCVQGGAAAVSAVRGPAHVHAASRAAADPAHDHVFVHHHHAHDAGVRPAPRRAGHFDAVLALAAGYAQAGDFPPRTDHAAHHHDEVQHHYHLPGSDAVLVHEEAGTLGAARTARSDSASAEFLALLPDGVILEAADATAIYALRPAVKVPRRIADRIERPPRSLRLNSI